MPFAAGTKTKILKFNAYIINTDSDFVTSTTLNQLIDEQMANIEENLPDLVDVIEDDLATLDTLDALLTTEQGSANATLIKADVLMWAEDKDKTSGIQQRFDSIRMRVARLLSQQITQNCSVAGGFGTGSLMRG